MGILFSNCRILSAHSVIENGFLGVEGTVIDYIGSSRPEKLYTEERDMRGKLLMPGLVNDHTHSAMVLMRGLGSDMALQSWLGEMWRIEDRMGREEIRAGMELALLEMIRGGTTCFHDMYLLPLSVTDIIGESGIKATISRCVTCFNPDEDYDTFENATGSRMLYDEFNDSYDGRLKVDFAVHAEYTSPPHIVRRYSDDCLKRGARMHIHLSETAGEEEKCMEKYGKTTTEYFLSLGLFENPTTCAHAVHLRESDMEILRQKGATCVHNPSSNLKLGSGIARIPDMLSMGVKVSLGTDGAASNNNLDMFEEMHLASLVHNGVRENPVIMPPFDVIDMATAAGAESMGRNDTGVLSVGKKADIIALDLTQPHSIPDLNTPALITYSLKSSDVTMTMVDGRILYENGEYKTLDRERIYRDVGKCLSKLYS